MLESALSALLASVAGHYAELSPSDVGIGLNGGRLAVEDVQLRPENLNSPALPFRVISGRAGILRVNVPWSALSSAPVSVYLENVELVAAPRSAAAEQPPASPPALPSALRWHETRLGRVLFNVQAEVVGLHIEYRDGACVANVQANAARAHSVDKDWNRAFVPLDGCGLAVAMRKLLAVDGLRCVMTPAEGGPCFESRTPLLDGVDVAVKMLLCAGEGERDGERPDGVHVEIDVELDHPALNLSRRQTRWIQRLFEQGLGTTVETAPPDRTLRRPRAQSAQPAPHENGRVEDPNPPRSAPPPHSRGSPPMSSADDDDDDEEGSDAESRDSTEWDDPDAPPERVQPPPRGGLLSLWHAIVAENSDETVDDAAYALGMQSAEVERRAMVKARARRRSASLSSARRRLSTGGTEEEEASEERFAREAVAAAAEAGGLTLRCRLRTPDARAWARVKILEDQLRGERMIREGLQDAEAALMAASERVRQAEEAANAAKQRNEALVRELADLEIMTATAGRNKDAMIRQIESALTEAERNAQILMEERANAWGVDAAADEAEERVRPRKSERRLRHASSDTFVVVGGSSEDDIEEDDIGESSGSESPFSEFGNAKAGNEYSGLSHGLPPPPAEGDTAEGKIAGAQGRMHTDVEAYVEGKRKGQAHDESVHVEKTPLIEQYSPRFASPPRSKAMEDTFSQEGLTLI